MRLKNLTIAVTALIALVAASCTAPEETITGVSEGFLKAWFSEDQGSALQYCSDGFCEVFGALLEEAENEDDGEDADLVVEMARQTVFSVAGVEIDPENKNFAKATVELTVPGIDDPVVKQLDFQKFKRDWKIINIE